MPGAGGRHFIDALGMTVTVNDGMARGRATIKPSMWARGTRRPRIGVLATLVDIVNGHVPEGSVSPTVDLRVRTLATIPAEGEIRVSARALRAGRRLIVSECKLTDASGIPFATGMATFMNNPLSVNRFAEERRPDAEIESLEELLDTRAVDDLSLELDPRLELSNGFAGTVQGGVQALLAEMTAERACGAGAQVVDLEIRYLDKVTVGPLRARATIPGRAGELEVVRVDLVDAGDRNRLVSCVSCLVLSS